MADRKGTGGDEMETITIKDIAKMCNVGVSTVSRAINNHPDINKETKEKIMDIIREYNYVPNNSARNLKRSESKAIAILIKGIDNPFFSDMIRIIEEEIQQKKYACIIQRVEEYANEIDVAMALVKEKRLKGIVFLGDTFFHTKEELSQLTVPFVLSTVGLVNKLDEEICSCVSVDDFRESYKVVDYLCKLGHKKIAIMIPFVEDMSIGKLRYDGYIQALLDNGMEVDKNLVRTIEREGNHYSIPAGYEAAKKLLEDKVEFTALYAITDSLAVGACRAIIEDGKKIPEDYSVAGFDGLDMGAYYNPSLTTIRQPVEDMAKATIKTLFNVIKKKGSHKRLIFEGELLERESTKKLED